jgi:uncharacterized protein YjbI with pentapeptide repeats
MKLPFIIKKRNNMDMIEMDFLENIKLTNDISIESFIKTLGYLLKNFELGNITKTSTEQTIVEMMNIINTNVNFDFSAKNRFFLTLFQELKNTQKNKQSTEILLISGIRFNSYLLKYLKLSHVIFIGCIFDETDLSESLFRNCEFRGCSFVESDLTKVKFIKSKFIGCDFDGATLDKTVGL